MEGGIMEADKGQGGEDAADEGCSKVMEEMSDKNGGRKRNHLSHTSSPGEMPNQQSKNRLAYNYRTLTGGSTWGWQLLSGGVKNHRLLNMQTRALSIGLIPKLILQPVPVLIFATEMKSNERC
jgi:hypothetical protein